MIKTVLAASLVLLLAAPVASADTAQDSISWVHSYEERLALAEKTGDAYLRRLLVGSAQYILGPFGSDSDLRRWGLDLAARGGKNAKKRAVVAVARKLAVLLHRLWVTAEEYEPLRNSERQMRSEPRHAIAV